MHRQNEYPDPIRAFGLQDLRILGFFSCNTRNPMANRMHHLSGYVLVLLLAIFAGHRQDVSLAGDQPGRELSPGDLPTSTERGNMSEMFKGTVVDAIDADRCAYIQVDIGTKRVWVAVPAFEGEIGDVILVPPGVQVADFHSKRLNREFEMVYFVGGIRRMGESVPQQMPSAPPRGHPPIVPSPGVQMAHPPIDELADVPAVKLGEVARVKNGKTVAEIVSGRQVLAGEEIRVRAKVVRFTPNVAGTNWLHVQDGSGEEDTNDLAVTTNAVVKVGDIVLIHGTVSVNRDLGFGISYPVILEASQVTVE